MRNRGGGASPLSRKNKGFSRNEGFTLAEVLITLGIIGVVAAMTMPTLVTNYKLKEYSVRLKRFYSTMQNAIALSEIDNEPAEYWDYPSGKPKSAEEFWNKYFAPYFKTVTRTEIGGDWFYVYFQDGSHMRMHSGSALDIIYAIGDSDKEDDMGIRTFYFLMYKDTGKFTAYNWTGDIIEDEEKITKDMEDRENLKKLCNETRRNHCSQLLFLDNWEFKDDYPLKIK